jgi:hypothetical protein
MHDEHLKMTGLIGKASHEMQEISMASTLNGQPCIRKIESHGIISSREVELYLIAGHGLCYGIKAVALRIS